jgi:cholesterol oxidase
MVAMTRRSFLAGTAATGATLALAKPARAATVKIIREDHRVVVVGSGFGGGVTALRLAQAGVKVTVLERGRRWPTGPNAETFPHASSPDKRALWYRSAPQIFGQPVLFDPYVGLLETIGGDNITAVCAAGVGGGSLVYQGMTLEPSEAVFNEVLPEQLDWQTMNRVHYPRVARMLGAQTAPDELINSSTYFAARVFGRNVKRAGYQLDKIPMPIDWSWALRELTGELKPSYTNGDCALGVNNGGKHSVDVTYIAAAEATGNATVLTQHEVTGVSRAPDGRWQIEVNVIDESGKTTEQKVLTAGALVMAAGTMNTSKLLMKAKQTVTDLPDGVGTGWGSNGDRIYVWSSVEDDFGAVQGGPVVYGTKDWSRPATANTVIQASLPPIGTDIRSTMMVGFGVSTGRRADSPGHPGPRGQDQGPGRAHRHQRPGQHHLARARRRADGDRVRPRRPGSRAAWPVRPRRRADPGQHRGLQPVDDHRRRRRASAGEHRRQRRRCRVLMGARDESGTVAMESGPPRSQLFVLAPDPADAVRWAGGWVFDRVMAGWEATVLTGGVGGAGDPRPMHILGARAGSLAGDLARGHLTAPDAVAVDADLWRREPAVRRLLDDAVEAGLTDVRFFGDVGADERMTRAGYRISIAAVAFKAYALAAAAAPAETVGFMEHFGVLEAAGRSRVSQRAST